MTTGISVAIAGALGALARWGVDDTYRLLDAGHVGPALANSVGSLAVGLAAVWGGIRLAEVL